MSRRKEIMEIKVEIKSSLKKIQKINKTKSLFFEKLNKIDKPEESLWCLCDLGRLLDQTSAKA